jgi:two-component system cell cycle sensor histidine kinase/response regulator CckA
LIVQTGQTVILDEDWMLADGRRRCMHTVKTPVFGADGTIIGSQGVLFDITGLKQVEAALRASEERLQLASSVGGVGTFEHNHLTGEMQTSSVLREIDGLGDGENRFATLVARMHPEDRAAFLAANRRAEDPASDGRVDHEHRLLQPDGSVRWMRVQSHIWFAGEGAERHAVRTIGTVMDITQRKQAEAELRANEARYRSLFENMLNGFAHCRMVFEEGQPKDFVYLAVNRAFESMTGLKDVAGKSVSTVVPGIREADPQLFELYGRVAKTGAPEKCEIRVTALQQWFDIAVYSPAPGEFVTVFDVITTRKKVEEGLRSLSRAVEQSPVSIIITDAAGAIEYVNPKFTEICGYTLAEVQGKNPRILKSGATAPEIYREMWATITAGREWHGELCNRAKGGELYWELASISAVVNASGRTTHFVAVKENITERRRLEEQLRRAQRMEAIGALSSGIAHDLNNILTPVMLAPALLRESVHGEHELQLLALIEQNAHRGAEIIRQLLMFSRGGGGERVPVQLRHLLKEICDIMVETFPREVAVESDMAAVLPPVLGDATQLHQVLLNLCVNARDAMPSGGTLSVRAINIMLDAEQVRLRLDAKPGPYVVITVTDTGQGIPPKIMERIFDPFFTTKGPGKGTGLGLSTALGIVRSHGGFLEVESEPDKGSTFSVYLPAASSDSPVPPREIMADPPRGRNELILVVDDESSICAATRLVLENHGYRTLTARGGDEALGIFRLQAAEISLVLTDIMMPGMDGIGLIRELRTFRPELKVMVTTGVASESKQTELAALGVGKSLPKPCGRRELLEAVQGALAG